jgi:ABC-type transport system involved in cytochrome bd biosynthesis fused ATPase/permease subunit
LSAVDRQVGANIIQKCFLGVLKDKVRILATHQVNVAKHADRVIALEHGRLTYDGSFENLDKKGHNIDDSNDS